MPASPKDQTYLALGKNYQVRVRTSIIRAELELIQTTKYRRIRTHLLQPRRRPYNLPQREIAYLGRRIGMGPPTYPTGTTSP